MQGGAVAHDTDERRRANAAHEQGLLVSLDTILSAFAKMFEKHTRWRSVLPWNVQYLAVDVKSCSADMRALVARAFGTKVVECDVGALVEIVRIQEQALNPSLPDWTQTIADKAERVVMRWRDMQVRNCTASIAGLAV